MRRAVAWLVGRGGGCVVVGRSRHYVPGAVLLLALPAGVGAAVLTLDSSRLDHPALRAFLTVLGAWAFVAGGLVARYRYPDNRTGTLMVLTGFLVLAGSLAGTSSALPFTAGQ